MGKLSLCQVCFMSWALLLMHSAAEPLYFLQDENFTWDQARNHCQVCFKDLVTVTPNSTYIIANNLTSDYWIGLRKNPSSNSTSNSTSYRDMSWSRWVNGDPLAFQNWYPGWPVFKSPFPKISCCSCSCTCPAVTTPMSPSFSTYATSNAASYVSVDANATDSSKPTDPSVLLTSTSVPTMPVEAACVKSPMLFPDLPDPDQNYIEDSCVAMLSIGAWVEKNCTDLLPFICYEDHFYGTVNVSNVTASSAVLTWLPGPGAIAYYRLEVTNLTGGTQLIQNVSLNLTYNLEDLSPGYGYTVKVFAVKCDRDIDDPQIVSFHTIPNKVENLKATNQTSTSITLSWNKPEGNADFYLVNYSSSVFSGNITKNLTIEVDGLTPGTPYTFAVYSGVSNPSELSDPSNITVYTRPGKVSNLIALNNTNISLTLYWTQPLGGITAYNVTAVNDSNVVLFTNSSVDKSTVCYTVSGLPPSTRINLSVTALGNNNLVGETVTVVNNTAPRPISNLHLDAKATSIYVTWNYSDYYTSFSVKFQTDGQAFTNVTSINITGLNSAAQYVVTVCSVSGYLTGPAVNGSIFTLPLPPTNATVIFSNPNQINFQWTAPLSTVKATYSVNLTSTYWDQIWTANTTETNYTFTNLTSGTKYHFEVRTLAGSLKSDPATKEQSTNTVPLQISLSMLCSSAKPLSCADSNTKGYIFNQLNKIFHDELEDNVYWVLNNQTSENILT